MTFWDGTRWVPESPSPPPRKRPVRHLLGVIAEGTLITALIFGLIAGAAFAAKGGNSGTTGHHGKNSSASATLVSDCNPCTFESYADLTGSGLDGSNPRGMVAVTSTYGGTAWAGINVNPDGTTAFTWYMNPAGTYTFKVYQQVHKKMVLEAELDGVVVQ